jgi:autotransporter-associated beta strand protein
LSAPATFNQGMELKSGNGRTLVNLSTNAVTLNGALAGGGNAYFWLYGPNGNGGFVLGGNNTSGSRLFTDNTSATIANSAAVNSFNFAILTENNGRTGRLYLANGVAMTKGVNYNQWGVISNSTPVYLGMSEAGAASISGIVDLNYYNNSGSTAVSDFHLETPAGATLTLSGQIKNSNTYANNRLVKIGAGTVAITNSNTYGGPTIVSNGTLWVNNTGGSGTGTGSVSVATNGILGGVGSITGAVSVAAGGTLAPGTNSVGTLTVGALTLSSNSTFAVQLNGTNTASYSRCVVTTGAVNLADSRLSVTVTGGYLPKVNDSFTIIRNTPGNAVSGRFANDSSIRAPGVAGAFEVSYAGGAGQDVVLRFVGVRGTVICVK